MTEYESYHIKSNFLKANNKLEETFYKNKNSFEDDIELKARAVFNELVQVTCNF